ncbi:MAG: hypothetical protein J6K13_11535 [Clostridia bacterium]|nr:hypothetical protein [Clostridia bacterium]
MKCPNCGQWNRASLPHCQKCGTPLDAAEGQLPSWKTTLRDDQKGKEYIRVDEDGEASVTADSRDALAQEMAELKKRKAEGTRVQRQLRRESAERGSAPSSMTIRTHATVDTFWNVEDNPRSTVRIRRSGEKDPEEGRTHRINNAWQDSRSYDPLWEEQEMYGTWQLPQNTQFTGKLPSRSRGLRHLARVLVAIIMAALLGLTIFFGYNYFKDRQAERNLANQASVTASIKDDLAAHTILIPGEDGQQIYIRELHTSYIVTGGFATVEIADHVWYDELTDFIGESMDVTLTPFVKTSGGQQKPLDPITYEISIPLSPITLNTPDGLRTEVATAMYSMNFTVRPGSTVYINDEDVSDTVNSDDGSFTYNATVQPIGDNNFVVRVRSQYCRENSMTVTLYREPQEIPLDLSADTYSSTSKKAIEIRATTLPGAKVEILSPHSDLNITEIDSTGAFSFYAVFDKIGYNTVVITASDPGKKTSRVEYQVYYLPNPDEYTIKAWPLNAAEYSELLANNNVRTANTQVYVAIGTIAEIISDKPQMAIMYTSEDGKSQPVLLENFTKTTWKVGEYYRIYGDANGTYSNMPRLSARYTYW